MDNLETGDTGKVLGNTAKVEFSSFGNRAVEGKVDTGATTSSLHATNINVNQQRGQVSFSSEAIGDNVVTLDLKGVQEVHSADGGGQPRPIVEIDVTVDGTPIRGAQFNLNDRSNMDSMVLIGQNILKAGHFTIDPNKGGDEEGTAPDDQTAAMPNGVKNESQIMQAIEVLVENNVSLGDILVYLQTAAINRIKE
jgi:hypothetical protein